MKREEIYNKFANSLNKCLTNKRLFDADNKNQDKSTKYKDSIMSVIECIFDIVEFATQKDDMDIMENYKKLTSGAAPNTTSQKEKEEEKSKEDEKKKNLAENKMKELMQKTQGNTQQMVKELENELSNMDFGSYF